MKCLLVLLVGILVACAPRPPGAYTPEEPDSGMPRDNTFARPDADPEDEDEPPTDDTDDADDQAPAVKDTGTKAPVDAGVTDPTEPYARWAGKYLMRIDMYSTADAMKDGSRLRVKNRVSNLLSVTLSAVDGKLVSEEKLCDQTYTHACLNGCTEWNTYLDKALAKTFFQRHVVKREYKTVPSGKLVTLTAEEATLPLGFDAKDPTAETPLPVSPSDPSVWKLDMGAATPDATRRGVRTSLEATLTKSGLTAAFKCTVLTVQKLVTSFSIEGRDPTDKDALVGTYYRLDASNADVRTIDVIKAGGATSTQSFCTKENFENQASMEEVNAVIFKRTDLLGCPATDEWENSIFQGSPGPPTFK